MNTIRTSEHQNRRSKLQNVTLGILCLDLDGVLSIGYLECISDYGWIS